jgi:hypothetical protein
LNRWQSKIDALIRLSRDPGATSAERKTAARKLRQILRDHPQMADYRPLAEFTMRDLGEMKRRGISTAGSWTGRNLDEAIAMMVSDYHERLDVGRHHGYGTSLLTNCFYDFRLNEVATEMHKEHFGKLPEWARKSLRQL